MPGTHATDSASRPSVVEQATRRSSCKEPDTAGVPAETLLRVCVSHLSVVSALPYGNLASKGKLTVRYGPKGIDQNRIRLCREGQAAYLESAGFQNVFSRRTGGKVKLNQLQDLGQRFEWHDHAEHHDGYQEVLSCSSYAMLDRFLAKLQAPTMTVPKHPNRGQGTARATVIHTQRLKMTRQGLLPGSQHVQHGGDRHRLISAGRAIVEVSVEDAAEDERYGVEMVMILQMLRRHGNVLEIHLQGLLLEQAVGNVLAKIVPEPRTRQRAEAVIQQQLLA